ncbi:HNH endonuclease family protein [Streptomyces sp. G-G2]|uniref:HNH endonuclease family protein n=1 Tax=Streptomyces sp. G-G2 TaxID=3046201 RepID=UPI0024BAA99C|nr:HNH endonuclease family protein [Streptomyces sp. G-G2]MDJ0382077.1 HNH endonuclease family protein [Streptomyces sp. G-G2]
MGRQMRVSGGVLAVTVLLAVAGCSSPVGDGKPGGPSAGAKTPKPSASAPGGGSDDAKPVGGDVLPGMVNVAVARTQLAALKVAPGGGMAGYSRAQFTHWIDQGNKCDTRETVLKRDGKNVTQDASCKAVSGTWKSLYDGAEITDAAKMDIDHMVPLAAAWRSGANKWTSEQRKAFANDLVHPQLLAVSASSNRSKGDQEPDLWQPPSKGAWCQYGRAWTTVKSTYGLTVSESEKKMLTSMLDSCAS